MLSFLRFWAETWRGKKQTATETRSAFNHVTCKYTCLQFIWFVSEKGEFKGEWSASWVWHSIEGCYYQDTRLYHLYQVCNTAFQRAIILREWAGFFGSLWSTDLLIFTNSILWHSHWKQRCTEHFQLGMGLQVINVIKNIWAFRRSDSWSGCTQNPSFFFFFCLELVYYPAFF